MPTLRIEHSVPNFEKWKQVFDTDPLDRKGSGVRRYRVLRAKDDPALVLIDLEFDSLPEAETFMARLEEVWRGPARAVMQNPRARIAESVEVKDLSQ